MSKFSEKRPPRRQRGDMLLESLIGAAIMTVVGAGTMQIAARISVGQHELRAQSVSVAQMRQLLNDRGEGLCGSTNNVVMLHQDLSANLTVDACDAIPSITVEPGVKAGGTTPNTVTVDGVRSVAVRMPVSNLGVAAAAVDVVVGTRQ